MQNAANSKIILVFPGPSPIKFLISPRRDMIQLVIPRIIIISMSDHVDFDFFFPYCTQSISWYNLWPLFHLSLSISENLSGSISPTSNHCALGLSILIVCNQHCKTAFNFISITGLFLVNTVKIFKVIKQYGD